MPNDLILDHFKSGKSLSPLEALNLGMGMRLAARVKELRDQGYDIQKEMVKANGKRFAKYFLKQTWVQRELVA